MNLYPVVNNTAVRPVNWTAVVWHQIFLQIASITCEILQRIHNGLNDEAYKWCIKQVISNFSITIILHKVRKSVFAVSHQLSFPVAPPRLASVCIVFKKCTHNFRWARWRCANNVPRLIRGNINAAMQILVSSLHINHIVIVSHWTCSFRS